MEIWSQMDRTQAILHLEVFQALKNHAVLSGRPQPQAIATAHTMAHSPQPAPSNAARQGA